MFVCVCVFVCVCLLITLVCQPTVDSQFLLNSQPSGPHLKRSLHAVANDDQASRPTRCRLIGRSSEITPVEEVAFRPGLAIDDREYILMDRIGY